MRVPLTIADFLDRAAAVHPDRTAVVDEPGVEGSLGRITYRQLADRATHLRTGAEPDLGMGSVQLQ